MRTDDFSPYATRLLEESLEDPDLGMNPTALAARQLLIGLIRIAELSQRGCTEAFLEPNPSQEKIRQFYWTLLDIKCLYDDALHRFADRPIVIRGLPREIVSEPLELNTLFRTKALKLEFGTPIT